MTKVADCIFVSMLWVIFCIPVFTIGASSAALYNTVHRVIRHNRDFVWSNFWRTFRQYFKKATIIWLIILFFLILTTVLWLITYAARMAGSPLGVLNPMLFIPFVYIIGICHYMFTYIVRFDTTIKKSMKNASILAGINLLWSLLMLVLLVAAALAVYLIPFLIFIVPALLGIVDEIILERIFRRIMRPEDLQKELDREKDEKDHPDTMR